MTHPIPDLFLVGTDRRVGKTVVSLLLMQTLFDLGMMPYYVKIIQTGCGTPPGPPSDAHFLYSHVSELKGRNPIDSVAYCLPAHKAPFFAARDQGMEIDPDKIAAFVSQKRLQHAPLIVEGTGGALVPVSETVMMVDLIKMLKCQPLVVARAQRGTINHTLLTVETLERHGLTPRGVVFVNDGSVPVTDDQVAENWASVEMFGGVDVLAVIGPIANFDAPDAGYHQALADIFF